MASKTPTIHVFILSHPAQGQINPLLRLGKRLASTGGFLVTFVTTAYSRQNIIKANGISPGHLYPVGDGFLRFDFFDVDDSAHINPFRQAPDFIPRMELSGRKRIPEMLRRLADEGRPVSCLINGTMFSWAYDVAEELGIPIATMWAQSCASFLTFYYCYNELVPFPTAEDPYTSVEIPTLPLLKWDELHSFLHPSYPEPFMRKSWLGEFGNLNKPFCILMNTFDELERDTIDFTSKLCPAVMPIGPLFKDPIAPNSAGLQGNPQKADTECLGWLDSKSRRSVVYVCFGSLTHLKQEQVDEIAHGILNAGAPFLWVMRPPEPDSNLKRHTLPEKAGPDDGRVVEYSPQEEVLAHPSVGCFVTHCGWNSTMEALASGVPMVAFPQWGDQLTDAKFLVEVFGVAVRMGRGQEDKVVPREEVERCIREATVGPKAEEMRRKAAAWKEKAEKACQGGGSSDMNLRGFVEEIRKRSGIAVEEKASIGLTCVR